MDYDNRFERILGSVSKDKFNDENKFVSKIMVSLIGINCSYNDEIDTFPFGKCHYIVDIDNKKIIFRQDPNLSEDDDIRECDNLINFQNYISLINNIYKNSFQYYLLVSKK